MHSNPLSMYLALLTRKCNALSFWLKEKILKFPLTNLLLFVVPAQSVLIFHVTSLHSRLIPIILVFIHSMGHVQSLNWDTPLVNSSYNTQRLALKHRNSSNNHDKIMINYNFNHYKVHQSYFEITYLSLQFYLVNLSKFSDKIHFSVSQIIFSCI